MNFNFIGMYVNSISKDTINTDFDGLLKLLNTDNLMRTEFCKVRLPKGMVNPDDITVLLSPIQFSYKDVPMDYSVYIRDDIIGYASHDFLYTGLKLRSSILKTQNLIEEIEFLESIFNDYLFFRRSKVVGIFEWLDQVLKGDPDQIHKHYMIRNKGALEIHLKSISAPNGYKQYVWDVNFPEFKAANEQLLKVLNKIFIQTAKI